MRTRLEIERAFAPRGVLASFRSFFLVGVGGAGMSGIARMLAGRGFRVRGSDSTESAVTHALAAEGIAVGVGHRAGVVEPGEAVVLTDAVPLDSSPEVADARRLGNALFRRSQVLGWLLEGRRTIAVTGSHGKTTTTGMVAAGLRAAGLDPTVVVGAEVPEFGGAAVEGASEWAVVEACEAYDSLRDLDPALVLLTNLELDHVDFHGDWEGLKASVLRFLLRLADIDPPGSLVACAEDQGCDELVAALRARCPAVPVVRYSREPTAGTESVGLPPLALPGAHNRLNAVGAAVACRLAGADVQEAVRGIAAFRGAERRLQVLREEPVTVIDDYAHHPTEIVATLAAVRERYPSGEGRTIVVFQPHLYSRTAPLLGDFARALSEADFVVLTDIYPAREDPIPGVSSWRIAERLSKPGRYVPQRRLLPREVAKIARSGDVVIGMGAGTIGEFAPELLFELDRASRHPGAPLRIAVLYGGDSAEREVSIQSGRAVADALRRFGHSVALIDVGERLLAGQGLAELTGPERPDVCFLAVHGTNAEDGAIQGLLDLLHLPYTGSGLLASALAFDKHRTKRVLESHGVPVPRGVRVIGRRSDARAGPPGFDLDVAEGSTSIPESSTGWVVKPNAQGSTVGLRFVDRIDDLEGAIAYAAQYGSEVLVEEWLRGVEVSVPVLGDDPLPVVEIVPAGGRYDFASKYTPGATEEVCPARLDPALTSLCQDYALRSHRALGCRGLTRTDLILTERGPVVLEVNTLPGMTATSLVPRSASVAGIDFGSLCERVVRLALEGR